MDLLLLENKKDQWWDKTQIVRVGHNLWKGQVCILAWPLIHITRPLHVPKGFPRYIC